MTRSRRRADQKLAQCKWEGCENPDAAHGFCRTHYNKVRYSKDLEHLLPPEGRAQRCWVPQCERPAYSHKLCRAHVTFVKHHDIGTVDKINAERVRTAKRKKNAVAVNARRLELLKVVSGSTLEDIASAAGCSREWARQVIKGNIGGADRNAVRGIAEHFGVPLAWLANPAPLTHGDLGIPDREAEDQTADKKEGDVGEQC